LSSSSLGAGDTPRSGVGIAEDGRLPARLQGRLFERPIRHASNFAAWVNISSSIVSLQ